MRDYLLFFLLVLCVISCSTYKAFDNQTKQGKSDMPDYVELKNGAKFNYSKIKGPKPPFINKQMFIKKTNTCWEYWDTWLQFDNNKVEKDSIYGYQLKGSFYTFINCHQAIRLRQGKINLYFYDIIIGDGSKHGSNFTVYSFEKQMGTFYTTAKGLHDFYNLISDNPKAAALCNNLFPNLKYKQTDASLNNLARIVDLYNNS